jgi:hypothetical protein
MDKIVKQVYKYMELGIYDPEELFQIIYPNSKKHYHTIRTAIHIAKTSIARI